jgi:hypothetical protein
MQLLLAVINSNLMTILAQEARDDMAHRMEIVAKDEIRLKQEEEELKNVKAPSAS